MIYGVLHHPNHNRVYFEASLKLAMAEFQIAAANLSTFCQDVQRRNIGGIDYLTFQTQVPLTDDDVVILYQMSFAYAVFEIAEGHDEFCLRPISKVRKTFVDDSISSMLKYTGKTNEIFTRMMINVAYFSQKNREEIHLLDPIAGKGTTLYEGLIREYHVHGIEISDKVVHEAFHFLKRFLESARYKFDQKAVRISGPGKSFKALRHTFEVAATKEDYKNKQTKTVELIAGNSLYADKYIKKNTIDMIVGDLPYGVQHGNVTNEKQSSLTRNPAQLLDTCLPAWKAVLKTGGSIVLAWNCNVLPREQLVTILEKHGFQVMKEQGYLEFQHRVDQAILRDIVVGKKY